LVLPEGRGLEKAQFLNQLLEIPDILPSSNSEVATSCACTVSFNDDDDPSRKFRAEVAFRSYEDVAAELAQIFALMRQREQDDDADIEDGATALDRMQAEAEMESGIAEGLKRISAVWGLDEEAVETMKAEDTPVHAEHS
jgi:hypothetical protein